jgi:hypothetical protein
LDSAACRALASLTVCKQKFLIKIKGTGMYKMNYCSKQTKHVASVHRARSFVRLLLILEKNYKQAGPPASS